MSRRRFVGKAAKAVFAGAMLSSTLVALGSFVLYRLGLDAYAGALLSDRFLPAFLGGTALSSIVLHRRFS